MNTINIIDDAVLFLGICLVVLLAGILFVKFMANIYVPFIEERDFIRMEIMRSKGDARIHWQHELRRLYIAQIPLIGGFLAERDRKKSIERRKKFSS